MVQNLLEQIFGRVSAVDGAGFARVDFFLRRDNNRLLVNELNTIPGLTDVSGFPQMWDA